MKLKEAILGLREPKPPNGMLSDCFVAFNAGVLASAQLVTPAHNAGPRLLEAAIAKLKDCRDSGDCMHYLEGEYCSNECVALAEAIEEAGGKP